MYPNHRNYHEQKDKNWGFYQINEQKIWKLRVYPNRGSDLHRSTQSLRRSFVITPEVCVCVSLSLTPCNTNGPGR